jgi:hypothetical protein
MSFVRIDQKGWETFTGLLGPVLFENGVSKRELTPNELARLGASVKLVTLEGDKQVGAATIMANSRHVSAAVKPVVKPKVERAEPIQLKYDKDKLEEIASEGGIKAVREVAKEFGVKGVEISKMIDDIVTAQLEPKE